MSYIKSLIGFVRQQKRSGKFKPVFLVYNCAKLPCAKFITWWRRDAVRIIYVWLVAILPNWENGHYTLARALHRQHTFLSTRNSYNPTVLTDLGNRATSHYRKVQKINPQNLETYESLCNILHQLGEKSEAFTVLQQLDHLKRDLAKTHQEDLLGIRFIPTRIAGGIGLLGNLDYYVKADILGMTPPKTTIMILPEESLVCNDCFLDYWRQYITVISDPKTIEALSPFVKHLEDPINWAQTCGGQAYFLPAANTLIQKQWDAEQRPPLMSLTDSDYQRGSECLEKLGIPNDAWFVCLHVRESGFKDLGLRGDSFRNADIDTYTQAIKTIVAHGGWVIRVGNPTMKPLPNMNQVIDYAHSDLRSDWMDVFLCSQCRFIIGTASGPNTISIAFGVPLVLTNYLPWGSLHFSNQDLFLPRLFWSLSEKRRLTFLEILSSPLSGGVTQSSYDRLGVEIIENTPEEINDIVVEMLMRLDGTTIHSESDEQLQERFQSQIATSGALQGPEGLTINSRIGRDFLRKYETLLHAPPQTEHESNNPGGEITIFAGNGSTV